MLGEDSGVVLDRPKGTIEYSNWNDAIAREFFTPATAGRLVYLDMDHDAFRRVCTALGVDHGQAETALADAVRQHLRWRNSGRPVFAEFDFGMRNWVRQRRTARLEQKAPPPPPHLALLMLLSMAAEHMGAATSKSTSQSGYYTQLERILQIPESDSGRFRKSFTESSESYWDALNLWLEDHGGRIGLPSAYSLMHRFVGLPISQALVRERERKNIRRMFAEQGLLPGMAMSTMDMFGILDQWIATSGSTANAALRKMWTNPHAQERIAEIALSEFEIWEGVERGVTLKGVPRNQGRCLLTLRDKRSGLSPQMRFGVLADGTVEAGEQAVVRSEEGASAAVEFEQLGLSEVGADLKGAGIDVASVLEGQLVLEFGTSKTLTRVPKNVIIFTKSAFSAGYVESDRAVAAVESRVLVRDSGSLRADVIRILDDAAQPGYGVVEGGDREVPAGWVLFDKIMIMRAPHRQLTTSSEDLSAFQPRLSSRMSLTGGLKLPGYLQRWSALASLNVAIASEEEDVVDLDLKYRAEDSLTWHSVPLHRDLEIPTVVPLEDLPEDVEDFTLVLSRGGGKEVLQRLNVRLRSSAAEDPAGLGDFRNLCHDHDDPLWPLRAVPGREASKPVVDGAYILRAEDVAPAHHTDIPTSPSWTRAPREYAAKKTVRIAGAGKESCLATGRHRVIIPLYDGKPPRHPWMFGTCDSCGMSKRYPTRGQVRKEYANVGDVRQIHKPLPPVREIPSRLPALLDALQYLGAGTRHEFSTLARQVEDSALYERSLLLELESAGVVELQRDENFDIVHWEVAASVVTRLPDESLMLTGYWPSGLVDDFMDGIEADAADSHVVTTVPPQAEEVLQISLAAADVSFQPSAGWELARTLPSLSSVLGHLPRSHMPHAESYQLFKPSSSSWVAIDLTTVAGLYRVVGGFGTSSYYLRTAEDVDAGEAARVPVDLGKHLAALSTGDALVAYDPTTGLLSVPLGAELPGLYARAAVLASGEVPVPDPKARSIYYKNVPPDAGSLLAAKVMS